MDVFVAIPIVERGQIVDERVQQFSNADQALIAIREAYMQIWRSRRYGHKPKVKFTTEFGVRHIRAVQYLYLVGESICPTCDGLGTNPANTGKPISEWVDPRCCPTCSGHKVIAPSIRK